MFKIVEKEINDVLVRNEKLLDIYKNEKREVRKEKNMSDQVLNYYDNIKSINKLTIYSSILFTGGVALSFVLPEIGGIVSCISLASILGLSGEKKETKKEFNNFDSYGFSSLKEAERANKDSELVIGTKDYLIQFKEERIKKYETAKSNIEKYKTIIDGIENSFDPNYKVMFDIIKERPILAFDDRNDYLNFLTYDEDVQDAIISNKILSKNRK